MERFFHITSRDVAETILEYGLQPMYGPRCESISDDRGKRIYLTDRESLASWMIILKDINPVVLEVYIPENKIDDVIYNSYSYGFNDNNNAVITPITPDPDDDEFNYFGSKYNEYVVKTPITAGYIHLWEDALTNEELTRANDRLVENVLVDFSQVMYTIYRGFVQNIDEYKDAARNMLPGVWAIIKNLANPSEKRYDALAEYISDIVPYTFADSLSYSDKWNLSAIAQEGFPVFYNRNRIWEIIPDIMDSSSEYIRGCIYNKLIELGLSNMKCNTGGYYLDLDDLKTSFDYTEYKLK